jgi:Na+/proline symporter
MQARIIRQDAIALMKKNNATADDNDTNYVFLTFVKQYLPKGLVGLLIAIIFLASMGSTASALNSLASTTVIDIYKRTINKDASDKNYLLVSRLATVFWGVVCVIMALYASKLGNLLEAVNQLGSYVYGTVLGVFVVAFYMKRINGTSVFIGAIVSEAAILYLGLSKTVAYLWLNPIGCFLVMIVAYIMNKTISQKSPVQVPVV